MSKIGKMPVVIPEGTSVEVNGRSIGFTGPKGTLTLKLPRGIEVQVDNTKKEVVVTAANKTKTITSLHGTIRSLIANNINGVSHGWSKVLELVGTGYRAEVTGNILTLNIGFSQPVKITAPDGITFKVEKSFITIDGFDREVVGQTAAVIRAVRPPEPYKGKGIKYQNEVIKRKAGKAAKAQGAA